MAIWKERLTITNDGSKPIILYVEPWGRDYTLLPQDTLDLVMESASSNSHFHVQYGHSSLTVFAEGDPIEVSASQDGKVLDVGHNRNHS